MDECGCVAKGCDGYARKDESFVALKQVGRVWSIEAGRAEWAQFQVKWKFMVGVFGISTIPASASLSSLVIEVRWAVCFDVVTGFSCGMNRKSPKCGSVGSFCVRRCGKKAVA